jgi:anti-sigma factor RsiW
MNCREFVDFLMAYLDDELDESVRAVFEAHLGDCRRCVSFMQTYEKTIELGRHAREAGEAGDGPIPEDAPIELVDAILAARKSIG